MTWNDYNTRRSDSVEELYSKLSKEQKEQIDKAKINFIDKLSTEWEPDKNECLSFFEQYPYISSLMEQAMNEWSEVISDSNTFCNWMVSLQRWKNSIDEDQLREDDKILFEYLTSVITAFNLLPISFIDSVSNRLIRWFQDGRNERIEFQKPIPEYVLSFTPQQHNVWLASAHSILFNHHKEIDLEKFEQQLSLIKQDCTILKSILSFIRNDVHLAISQILQFLRKIDYSPIYLLPYLQYLITHHFTSETEQLLSQLSIVSRLFRDSEFTETIQVFHYLYYKDVVYLENCFKQPSPRSLFLLLKTGLFYPQGVFINPSSFVSEHLAPLGFCNSVNNAVDWLDKNEDYFLIVNEMVDQNNLHSLLNEEERAFVQQKAPFQSSVLEYYTQENLPLLDHTLQRWRVSLHENYAGDEKYRLRVGECLRMSSAGMTDRAFCLLTETMNELKKKKADFWHAVYCVVVSYLCWEKGRLFLDMESLDEALYLFVQCKHRKLVLWCLLVKTMVRDDCETMKELINYADEDCIFSSLLYFLLYQKRIVDFSSCMIECKNAKNLHLAKKAVEIEVQRNGGNAEFIRRWNDIQKEDFPWLSFHKIL